MTMTADKVKAINNMCPTATNMDLGGEIKAIGDRVATFQADSVASDVAGLVADFNALLAKLQTAGLMATE